MDSEHVDPTGDDPIILADTLGEEPGAGTQTEEPAPQPGPRRSGGEERAWAMIAHLLGAAGYLMGPLGWVGPLVVWVKCRGKSPLVAFHSLQALFFHLSTAVILFVSWRVAAWNRDLVYLLWFAILVPVVWSVVAAVRTYHDLPFQYPVVGAWALELTGNDRPMAGEDGNA